MKLNNFDDNPYYQLLITTLILTGTTDLLPVKNIQNNPKLKALVDANKEILLIQNLIDKSNLHMRYRHQLAYILGYTDENNKDLESIPSLFNMAANIIKTKDSSKTNVIIDADNKTLIYSKTKQSPVSDIVDKFFQLKEYKFFKDSVKYVNTKPILLLLAELVISENKIKLWDDNSNLLLLYLIKYGTSNKKMLELFIKEIETIYAEKKDEIQKLLNHALLLACEFSTLEVVEMLCNAGADINSRLPQEPQTTILHITCESNSSDKVKIAKFLLNKNPLLINIQNQHGSTALHMAILREDLDLIKILFDYNPSLHLAIQITVGSSIQETQYLTPYALSLKSSNSLIKNEMLKLISNKNKKYLDAESTLRKKHRFDILFAIIPTIIVIIVAIAMFLEYSLGFFLGTLFIGGATLFGGCLTHGIRNQNFKHELNQLQALQLLDNVEDNEVTDETTNLLSGQKNPTTYNALITTELKLDKDLQNTSSLDSSDDNSDEEIPLQKKSKDTVSKEQDHNGKEEMTSKKQDNQSSLVSNSNNNNVDELTNNDLNELLIINNLEQQDSSPGL